LRPGQYVCLSVADNGAGMDEETLARVTEPFFTTKGIGKGTGLGLSMVDGVMEQSGGKLVVQSLLGVGTTIELWLPVAEKDVSMPMVSVSEKPRAATQPQRLILAVDDDSLILSNIDLVVSDQAMPGMSGIQLADAIRDRWPKLPVIIATGYAELPAGANPNVPRLSKPFTQQDLARAVSATMRV